MQIIFKEGIKLDKHLLGTLGMLTLILVVGFVSATFSVPAVEPGKGGLRYGSTVCIEYKDGKSGESRLISCSHNTLTNNGKDTIEDVLNSTHGANINTIALCNSSNTSADGLGNGCTQPLVTDNNLTGEYKACGLSRAAGTLTDQGNGNFSEAYTFTATCNSLVTNVTGIFNATGNLYFAGNNFTSVTLQSNDQLTVTWYIWVS